MKKKNKKRVVAAAISGALIVTPVGEAVSASQVNLNNQNIISEDDKAIIQIKETNTSKENIIENQPKESKEVEETPNTPLNKIENEDKGEENLEDELSKKEEVTQSNNEDKVQANEKEENNNGNNQNIKNEEAPPSALETRKIPRASEINKNASIVNIPDKNLKIALNEELGKGPVTADITVLEMENIYQYLDLHNKGITDLTGLNAAKNVMEIYLSENNISTIKKSYFSGMNKLEVLHLRDTNIASIEGEAFSENSNLRFIDMSDNKLTSIEYGMFKGISSLQDILFNNNQISEISENAFEGCQILRLIYLENNKIQSINPNFFKDIQSLFGIDFRHNQIKTIKSNTFSNLNNLQVIDLEGNQIDTLENNAFNNLPFFSGISIVGNKLNHINSEAFQNVNNMQQMYLRDNQITSIENIFFNMPNLNTIDLSNNKIENIGNSFKGATKLENLILDGNSIKSINKSDLSEMTNLNILFLVGNQISNIDRDAFSNLTNLNRVDLSNNKLESLNGEVFRNNSKLNGLEISNNYLTDLTSLYNYDFPIYAYGQKYIYPKPITGDTNNIFNIDVTMFDNIKGFKDPLNDLSNTTFQGNDISDVKVSDDGKAASFKVSFFGNTNKAEVGLSYYLPCDKYNKHYSVIVEGTLNQNLEFFNLVNSIITKNIDDITLEDGEKLPEIKDKVDKMDKNLREQFLINCPLYSERITAFIERAKDLKDISNVESIDKENREEIYKIIDKIKSISKSQCIELKNQINSAFIMGVDLIEKDGAKFKLDNIKIENKNEVVKLINELNLLKTDLENINKLCEGNITLENTNIKINSLMNTLKALEGRIQELEIERNEFIETMVNEIKGYMVYSVDEISIKDSKNIINLDNKITLLSNEMKKEILEKVPGYTVKMPHLMKRADFLNKVSSFNGFEALSSHEINQLIKEFENISHKQRVELKKQINHVFSIKIDKLKEKTKPYSIESINKHTKEKLLDIKGNLLIVKKELEEMISSIEKINFNKIEEAINPSNRNAYALSISRGYVNDYKIIKVNIEEDVFSEYTKVNKLLSRINEIESQEAIKPGGAGNTSGNTLGNTSLSGKLTKTGNPLASLVLVIGSAALLGGGYILFRRKK